MVASARLRWVFGVVAAAAALLLFVRSASVPLLDPDEARFARTSVEMMRSGDVVVPTFGGEPRLAKPPLLHWIQSFLFRTLGVDEWTARLPGALATLGSIGLAAWIASRRYGEEAGIWVAAVVATTPLVVVSGRLGTLDALLAVHVLAVVALDLAVPRDERSELTALSMGALAGLAFLVKGPVGVILPALLVLAGRTAAGRDVLPSLRGLLLAAAAGSAVVLPWGLAFLRRVGSGSTVATLRTEVIDRFFAGTTHVEPFWYYGKVVAVVFLPWLAPLVAGLVRAWRLRRSPASRTARYAAAGLLGGLVFFSISQGKLPSYILPLAPFAALVAIWELGCEIEAPEANGLVPGLLAATVAALALLLGLGGALHLEGPARFAALAGSAAYGAGALASVWGAVRRRPRVVYGSAAAAAWLFLLAVVTVFLPELGRTKSAATLVEQVPALRSGRTVVTVEMKVPSLTFYTGRAVEVLDLGELEQRLDAADDPLFVFADVDLPDVPAATLVRLREIARQAKFRVFVKRG